MEDEMEKPLYQTGEEMLGETKIPEDLQEHADQT